MRLVGSAGRPEERTGLIMSRFILTLAVATCLLACRAGASRLPDPLTGAFDPEQVLVNLEQRIAEQDWKRYGDFLSPKFRFIPYSSVYLEYPTAEWALWGRDREIQFIEELVSPSYDGATLVLLDGVVDRGPESRGRAEWDIIYTLTARDQVFRSRAIFVFEKLDNLWYLREWIDTTIETDEETQAAWQTSGSLRGALIR
jgi:hypothetical protein